MEKEIEHNMYILEQKRKIVLRGKGSGKLGFFCEIYNWKL